mmetsp:Transcript_102451/g.187123  ORF Transcript_102451/g.187123 Transcript_102451/m.187123 type:complete len:211 (+) Transcript_102451:14-646(+)
MNSAQRPTFDGKHMGMAPGLHYARSLPHGSMTQSRHSANRKCSGEFCHWVVCSRPCESVCLILLRAELELIVSCQRVVFTTALVLEAARLLGLLTLSFLLALHGLGNFLLVEVSDLFQHVAKCRGPFVTQLCRPCRCLTCSSRSCRLSFCSRRVTCSRLLAVFALAEELQTLQSPSFPLLVQSSLPPCSFLILRILSASFSAASAAGTAG